MRSTDSRRSGSPERPVARALATIAVALCVVVAGVPPAAADATAGSGAGPGQVDARAGSNDTVRVVVVFEDADARANASFGGVDATVVGGREVEFMPVLFVRTAPESIPEIERLPGVEYAVRDRGQVRIPPTGATSLNESATSGVGQDVPWGVRKVGGPAGVGLVPASDQGSVDVAVFDTGIDFEHPDLADNVVWGANFSYSVGHYGVAAADDNQGHGTSMAGILAAEDNIQGVVGVAPDVDLYSIKVLTKRGYGAYSWTVEGIQAALDGPDGKRNTSDDADVLSLSLGGPSDAPFYRDAFEAASDHAIVVAAAGNSGDGDTSTNEVDYPAKFEDVVAVAASDRGDSIPRFSSEGEEVEVAAPGVRVQTTTVDGNYRRVSGTSAATPHVAGAMALLVAADRRDGDRDYTDRQLRERLRETAKDVAAPGVDRESGYGRIRVGRAVRTLLSPTADAGDAVTVREGQTVQLNADGSRDPNSNATAYRWTQTAGPSVTLRDASTVTPTFEAPEVDGRRNLTFEVNVSNDVANDTDTVRVTVRDSKPSEEFSVLRNASTRVAAGERVRVSLEVQLNTSQDRLAIVENATAFDDLSVEDVGIGSGDLLVGSATGGTITVAFQGLKAGDTVSVTYTVEANATLQAGTNLTITGEVSSASGSVRSGATTITVAESVDPVVRADTDGDGSISTAELSAAVNAWAAGEYDSGELSAIVQAWAQG